MKYGLIGERLGHSFSKVIHGMLGDYEYLPVEIAPDELNEFMQKRDFLGINVTMPYKASVIPYLDWIDEPARKIGAVNTIINRDGRLYGYNTDYYGMLELIICEEIKVEGKKALIIGTGGTSATAEAVLKFLGAREILKISRSGKDGAITYEELYARHSDSEIIVNTTPVGMFPDILDCPIDLSVFTDLSGVIDAIYNPISTTLVQKARNMGVKAIGGLYMLVYQAVKASEIFLGKVYADEIADSVYESVKCQKESIVLIGMPASGKSTVGKIIADKLGRKFVDTDDVITERIGMPISDFFKKEGEAAFRRIETQVIEETAKENGLVISTGGGAILNKNNIENLKYNGKLFFIDRPLERLVPTDDRPLSKDEKAMEKLYRERYPIYIESADVKIDASCNADDVADKILEFYK